VVKPHSSYLTKKTFMIYWFIFFALLAPIIDSKLTYVFLVLITITGSVRLVGSYKTIFLFKREKILLYITPFLILISWLYSVFVALYNNVNVSYVFSNFVSLPFYMIFYVLLHYPEVEVKFYKIMYYSACIASIVASYFVFDVFFMGGGLSYTDESISSGRIYMSSTLLYTVPFIFMYLVSYSLSSNSIRLNTLGINSFPYLNKFVVLFFLFCLIVPAVSKGFILVFVIILIISTMLFFLKKTGWTGVIFKLLITALLGASVFLVVSSDFFELLKSSFSSSSSSNSLRSEQYNYLVNEITMVGSGVGSSLASGYTRDDTGYGFELTYVNLVNKLGILSLSIFISYLITLYYCFKLLFVAKTRVKGAFLLGAMAYLLPGSANPMLLGANFVLIHCITMCIIIGGNINRLKK